MKKFIFYCIIFCCLVGIVLLPIELLTRNIPNSYKEKNRWLQENSKQVETLILGNSHTYMGVDPAYLSHTAFNLSNVSQPYKYDYILLEKYIDHMPALNNLILPLSYHSLVFNLANDGEWWREINYNLYMDCSVHPFNIKYHFEVMNPRNCITRCMMYYIYNEDLVQMTELGFSTNYKVENKEKNWDNGKERAIIHTKQERDLETLQENLLYLNKIAAICNEHKINLFLVTLPVTESYRNATDERQIEMMRDEIHYLLQHYSQTYYINLWEMDELSDNDFFNGDHISTLGAIKVTKRIEKEIENLLN